MQRLHTLGVAATLVDERAGAAPGSVTGLPPVDSLAAAVVSPGVPAGHRWLVELAAAGIPVFPEFEFGLSGLSGVEVIAVTGTNGKSSLVKWLADTLVRAGRRAVPAGNYGVPVCALVEAGEPLDVLVLELSSFQLEQARDFRAAAAVMLNLQPNHLDRHADMAAYTAAKARIFAALRAGDPAYVHAPAQALMRSSLPPGAVVISFGESGDTGADWRVEGSVVHGPDGVQIDLAGTWWAEHPQVLNAAAGVAVLSRWGVDTETMVASARAFIPLPHRMEPVTVWGGISVINDSKASTLSALAAAVRAAPSGTHLIAGGILKEHDVFSVKEILVQKHVSVYGIGMAAPVLCGAWSGSVSCHDCGTLEKAVARAMGSARPGEWVLLSPGCSSFDQFEGYAHRGDEFKRQVHAWIRHQTIMDTTTQGASR
jgi:UDP-N-acetylmuramoylalanine--D-glutamate ligase